MNGPQREAYLLGRHYLDRGDPERALGHLQRVLERCPGFADVHYMVGLVHDRLDDPEAATGSFEKALRINPGYAEAFVALASLYESRGEYERSRSLAERMGPAALEASGVPPVEVGAPDPVTRAKLANLHAALGDAYRDVGDLKEAIQAYRSALQRCPGFHDIRLRLGMALREAGLASQAIREFQRLMGANESYLEAAVQLGLAYYSLGRSEDAIAEWERVLERDATREDALMYLRLLHARG